MTLKNGFGKCSLFGLSTNGWKDQNLASLFSRQENPNMEKALLDWPILLQYDVKVKYEVFSPKRSLNQPKASSVCILSMNQSNRSISVRLLFLFVRVFPFQGHKKTTLLVLLTKRTRQPWHSSLKGTASWCVMAVYSILLVIKLTFSKKYHFQFKLLNNRDHIKKLTGWAVWSKNPSCNPFQSALIFAHPGLLLSVFPV